MTSQLVVGRSVTDLLKGVKAGYLLNSLKELTTKSYSVHLKANLTVTSGQTEASQDKEISLNVNFYCSKLVDSNKRVFAYCLVF